MKNEIHLGELLCWRFERAGAEAPPAPSAARLLGLARACWEKWPEKYEGYVEPLNLSKIVNSNARPEAHCVVSAAMDATPAETRSKQG
jgi:hypothetical protein